MFSIRPVYTRVTSNASGFAINTCNDLLSNDLYTCFVNIHEKLKSLRAEKKLSLMDVAKDIGVSWQTIQQWENGKTAPKRLRLQQVAEYYAVAIEDLMGAASSNVPAQLATFYEGMSETHQKSLIDFASHLFNLDKGLSKQRPPERVYGDGEHNAHLQGGNIKKRKFNH